MLHVGQYVFKQAESEHEFEQIHALNYRTFVDEIAQYPDPGTAVRHLKRTSDGCLYMIARWERLDAILVENGHWSGPDRDEAVRGWWGGVVLVQVARWGLAVELPADGATEIARRGHHSISHSPPVTSYRRASCFRIASRPPPRFGPLWPKVT